MTAPAKGLTKAERAAAAIAASCPAEYHRYGPNLRLLVLGTPKSKGSLRHVGGGRLVEQVSGSSRFRLDVKDAAIRRMAESHSFEGPFPLDGPIGIDLTITVAKPGSAPKLTRSWPVTRSSGDLDKLQRNVFDALADAGVLADDARIVDVTARKVYPGEHPQSLRTPGALIFVYRIGAEWAPALTGTGE